MRGRTAISFLASCGALTIAVAAQTPKDQDAYDWFLQAQEQAYEAVMPLRVPDRFVTYRFTHQASRNRHERYFAIQYMRFGEGLIFPGALSATVVEPVGQSIQDQLIDLRTRFPSASLNELVARVSVRKGTVDVDQCRAISAQVKRLAGLQLTIPSGAIIRLDAPVHELAVRSGPLEMVVRLDGGGTPLIDWAVRTHELLMACVSGR